MISQIDFHNANSRDTYFSVHNVKRAHLITKGEGVRVGIIDWLFAYNANQALYSGYADISGYSNSLYENEGHGRMMATTLHEIAPNCEIFAINAVSYENGVEINRISYLEHAVDWAIANEIDILTYSQAAFVGNDKIRANAAVRKASDKGIITTFIHNDSEENIWPYGCMPFIANQGFNRKPDVNIYHFDYNSLYIPLYEKYNETIKSGGRVQSGNDLPYFSFSSMSPVLAGFIALLKSIDPMRDGKRCRDTLIDTSYSIINKGENWYDINPCDHVVDIGKAVAEL